ncbi:hypothetical protein [Ruegeria sp. Ofav3-42]|uniref:hypothetical protein n=1 Tax=Ruegeria sp. Ofav3-42 TaxID=2917759 RepID=UPI001EF49D91|nr:hypothetical protein [Ruegeria sp. Ofav3-42]MCG7521884.1 hypothetical protein [Ruegeria sp. Ofav3-42]
MVDTSEEQYFLADEDIELEDGRKLSLISSVYMPLALEERTTFRVRTDLDDHTDVDSDLSFNSVWEVSGSISNPIEVGFVLYEAGRFGACFAARSGLFTIRKAVKTYDLWKEMHPDSSAQEALTATVEGMANDKDEFRHEFKVAAISCATYGIFGNRKED